MRTKNEALEANGYQHRLSTLFAELPSAADELLTEMLSLEESSEPCRAPGLPTILDLFSRQVAERPDAPALSYQARRMTYSELDLWSNRLARWLIDRCALQPVGTPLIPFCLGRGMDQVALLLAILKTGGAYVPLDRHAPPVRNRFVLQDISAQVLIADNATIKDMSDLLADGPSDVIVLNIDEERSVIRACSSEPLEIADDNDCPCYIMYTSGSTGKPKGALIPRRGVVRLVHETNYVQIKPADVFSQAASVSFDAATFEVWGALLNGSRLVLVDTDVAVDPVRFRNLLEQEKVTITFLTTGLFNQLVAADASMFGGLRYLMFGGEAASVDAVRRLMSSGRCPAHLYNVYGPTENTTYSTFYPITEIPEPGSAIPIGRTISGSTCHVVDENLQPVKPGSTGELLVGGIGVALGYIRRPDLTSEKFISCPFEPGDILYRTGDLVQLREDGTLVFQGRVDNQVKIRGFRIEIEEVEMALDAHPHLAEVAVLVEDDVTGTKRLAAYLRVTDGQPTPSAANLRAHLEQHVPPYMVPSAFRRVDRFPLGLTGKVDRRALATLPAETITSETEILEPRNALETEIRDLWAAQLGVAPSTIGVETNFFTLGGQSLLAAAIVTQLSQKHQLEIRLADLLGAPTVAALARAVTTAPKLDAVEIPKTDLCHDLPLSWSQEQIWLHQQVSPESAYYNEPLDITIPERLDVRNFERALAYVLQRHESLRMRLEVIEGRPRQRVESLGELRLNAIDLRHLSPERRSAEARRLATAMSKRPFDLTREHPIRFLLLRLEDELYRLHLVGHHVALDGVGMFQVFLPELECAYRAYVAESTPSLAPLAFSWRDWLVFQRTADQPLDWTKQLDYWSKQLADLPVLELPTDRTRGSNERFDGSRVRLQLGSHITLRLKELARNQSTSLFAVLLAAYKTLLHRYTGQEDIAVASVVAGRGLPGLEKHVCDTLNTLILRTEVPKQGSFLDLLSAVHDTCVNGFANQDVPFQLVARRFTMDPSRERSVPVQVAFVLEPGMAPSAAGWEMNQLDIHTDTAKFDLTMELDERADQIIGRVEYRSDIFDTETIERFVRHYTTLLEGIAGNPASPIAKLPILDEAERRQILATWNDTTVNYDGPDTLHELVENQAEQQPDAPAIIQGSRVVTFKELICSAKAIARRLTNLGVTAGHRVGVWTDRTPEHLIAQLGIMMSGAAYVPLASDEAIERARFILADASVHTVLTDAERAEQLQSHKLPFLNIDAAVATPFQESPLPDAD